MQEENITQQQSLAIIESMINKAKNQFSENGFAYLLWGWVILFCSVPQFVLQYFFDYPGYSLVWMLTWLAAVVQVIYSVKKGKRRIVKTYTDEIARYVWLVFIIIMMLAGTLIVRLLQPQQYYISTIIILILYGMPTFLSGIILKFRPLVTGGICCWVLSVIAGFLPKDFIVLMLAAAVIIAWIIPGYLLSSRYKKENQQ
jgi:hypothetical protein